MKKALKNPGFSEKIILHQDVHLLFQKNKTVFSSYNILLNISCNSDIKLLLSKNGE